ncbi:ABC transporter related protein [Caldicellulosiruptor acetigenus I77R1B]|uniref:ABC transporter related protein n=1 Tax=Caldicellulosiruptor acetigenus (strain ATCC 700853 / DSM 12137 / I77R1B) TaxID=632335 RepID=E4S7L1_CALA7|nr:ABC transporter ATP-binding protein [Caldicellulosiruptor acetigenus]ADQ39856.1 ABC transporter related protein [Caldicellulosiruptor acetigenus I77R1B]
MAENQVEMVIKVTDVYKKIGNSQILKEINFSIGKGEIVGLVGPNGAGKSTLMKILSGLWSPKPKGKCYILGCDMTNELERIEALRRSSFFIETPALYLKLSGYDNIELYAKLKYGSAFNVKDEVNRLAPFFELDNKMLKRKAKTYSLGTKQKVSLLQMFIGNPEVLILDEPFNGLDPTTTIKVKELLKTRWRENNITVLISSHILSDIEELCSRIIFIKNGSIILDSNKEELLKRNTVVIFHLTEKEHVDIACSLIKEKLPYVTVETQFNNSIKIYNLNSHYDVLDLLQNEGIVVKSIEEQKISLVDLYKQLYLQ